MDPAGAQGIGRDDVAAIVILIVAWVRLKGRIPDASVFFTAQRALWWAIYGAVVVALVRRFGTRWLTWTARRQPALCILLVAALLSSLWSLDPPLTLHKAVSVLGTTIVGVYIGYTTAPDRLVRVLYWTFALLIVSSVLVSLSLGTPVGPGVPAGWRGVMVHKNTLGTAAVLAFAVCATAWLARRVRWPWGAGLCALSLFTVVEARSRTAFAALAVLAPAAAYLAGVWGTGRPSAARWRRLSFGLVCAVSILPFLIAPFAIRLGQDDPLNGRGHLWTGATAILRERPLTGYGLAAVWARADASLLPHIRITAHRSASSAHNSIVQVATELGIPAAIVASLFLVAALVNAGHLFATRPSPFSFIAVVFLVAMVVFGFTEAHLLQIHWPFWILFVAVPIAVQRALETPAGGGRRHDDGRGDRCGAQLCAGDAGTQRRGIHRTDAAQSVVDQTRIPAALDHRQRRRRRMEPIAIVKRYARQHPWIELLRLEGNGKAEALRARRARSTPDTSGCDMPATTSSATRRGPQLRRGALRLSARAIRRDARSRRRRHPRPRRAPPLRLPLHRASITSPAPVSSSDEPASRRSADTRRSSAAASTGSR